MFRPLPFSPRLYGGLALFAAALPSAFATPQGAGVGGAANRSVGMPSSIYNDRIKFDNLVPGTIVSEIQSTNGFGPIFVHGTNLTLGTVNAAVVFNSSSPTGGDLDLGSPNVSFGGPGIGNAGASGAPYENSTALERLLIVGENLVDGNGDGLVDVPNDAEILATKLAFDFGSVAPVIVRSITFIDVQASNPTAKVELFNSVGTSLGIIELPTTGNNGVATVELPNVLGTARMEVLLNGSGGIDEIVFAGLRIGRLGDQVWCDEIENGIKDPSEPGLPGVRVNLRDAGPDGLLDTPDDELQETFSDQEGRYMFQNLAPGLYRATVDPSTAPPGKVPGLCPTVYEVFLIPFGIYRKADFCFVERPSAEIGDFVWCDVDNDGVQDPLEPGVDGIRVTLRCAGPDGILNTADDILDEQLTNSMGGYLFTGLAPGTCQVTLDQTSIPPGKEVGVCTPQVTVPLAPGQSYLDADFCIVFNSGHDCCEHGRPVQLTLLYTGQDCSATVTTQASGKWSCSGNPGFAQSVFVRSTNKSNPTDLSGNEWFEGHVDINHTFVIDAVLGGADRFPADTWVHVFDVTGTTVLQSVKFHTSCSQPLATGQQYGSMRIVGCRGENEPVEGDCCENGRPRSLTFRYTGEGCSASSHSQEASKVSCSGNPNFAPQVFIRSSNSATPTNTSASIYFQGLVDLNADFDVDALSAGLTRLGTDTWIHIFATNGTTLLQTVKFHTSCSQPLFHGNQFGANLLVGCVGENEPVPGDCCHDGRPRVLTFVYTGESCSASSHSQEASKVSCTGNPALASQVFIRSSNSATATNAGAAIYFQGNVDLNGEFDVDAANAGLTRLGTDTWIHIFNASRTTVLQTVRFHTSCSQPLFVGNQFGANRLIDCVSENEPGTGGGTNVCANGRPRILLMQYTGNSCVATMHNQDPSKVSCSGDPAGATPVFVRGSDKLNPTDPNAKVWFTGNVLLNGIVDLDASRGGEARLKADTYLHVYNVQGGTLLQTVRFHTSCSQPLRIADVFGAFVVTGFTPE